MQLNINIKNYFDGWNDKQVQKMKLIEADLFGILNSPYFKSAFLDILSTLKYKNGETSAWKHASPEEIYHHFYSGMEVLQPKKDNEMDLEFKIKNARSSIFGWTYGNTITIWQNTDYYNDFSLKGRMESGSNIVHEWGHKLGFGHDFYNTARRDNSLCYLLNKAYEEAFIRYHQITIRKTQVCYRSWKTLFFKRCYLKDVFIKEE